MRPVLILLCLSVALFAQLDTAGLSDNTWVNQWNLSDPLSINASNWAYENDFHSHPFYGFFIMGPGHVSHPQDCYWYPFDPIKKKWTKIDSPRRPPRQCLSAFAVSSQDTAIMQMGGFENSHQQSQGRWDASCTSIDLGGARGAQMWVYSFNRNEWYPMKGPVTLPPLNATQIPQYDPVHDIVISTQGSTGYIYNFHTNSTFQMSNPASFAQYDYSAAVDTRRGLYYVSYSGNLYCFNPESGTWTTIPGSQPGASAGGHGLNLMAYDEINDIMLYVGEDNGSAISTWIFKCDSLKWVKMTPTQAPADRGRLAYNRTLNVFMLLGGTSTGGTISRGGETAGIWGYRYKRGPGVFAGLAPAPRVYINTTGGKPTLRWNVPAGGSITGYNVYRGTAATYAKSFSKLNSSPITDTFYTDASATAATAYAYKVIALKSGNEGEMSRILYTRPGRVLNVVASVEDTNTVLVSWDANPAEEVTGYDVYRARGTAIYSGIFPSGYTKANSSPLTTTSFTDNGAGSLKDRTARGYVVIALNGLGNSSGVSPECTTFPESPEWASLLPAGQTTTFRWQPPRRARIKGVNLYRIHPDNETPDPTKLDIMTGGANYYSPTKTYATLQNGTLQAPALITDTLSPGWPMPPTPVVPTGTDIVGYYLQGNTYIARAVNILDQEGFGTDQISPVNTEYGYGIVPLNLRFKYSDWAPPLAVEEDPVAAAVEGESLSASPNPLNPSTAIAYTLDPAAAKSARLAIFDASGRLIKVWPAGTLSAGRRTVTWNGRDNTGASVASGVYLLRLDAAGKSMTKRLVLAR